MKIRNVVTACSVVGGYQSIGRTYSLSLPVGSVVLWNADTHLPDYNVSSKRPELIAVDGVMKESRCIVNA